MLPELPSILQRNNESSTWAPMVRLHSAGILLLAAGCTVFRAYGQGAPPNIEKTPSLPHSFVEMTSKNATAPCLEPPALPGLEDYNGPLKKTVGMFANALERKAVHRPHYKAGMSLCTLDVKDKFLLFVNDSIDPITFLSAGFDAAIDQATNRDPQYGQGLAGYGKRSAANLADRVTSKFAKDFVFPSIFSEDPRYYRLGQGPVGKRVLHAAAHVFVAHHAAGTRMFNYSEWLGTTSSVLLSNSYHPGNERGFGPTASRIAFCFANDIGYDILREFWPEISLKLKLPFTR